MAAKTIKQGLGSEITGFGVEGLGSKNANPKPETLTPVSRVSIITPVWNQVEYTTRYLLQNREVDAQFIIIDNGSTDATPRILEDWRKPYEGRLTVITNSKNEGFPVACNQGATVATGDILLFLNNDVMIHGDYITPIREIMTDDIIAGPELNGHYTGWNLFGNTLIAYIAGWCLAITKKTFEKLGGFDERYTPCDYEDVDLSYKAQEAGKRLVQIYLPVRHFSGVSALPDRRDITLRNQGKFREKWGL